MNTSILNIGLEIEVPAGRQSNSNRSSRRSNDFSQDVEGGDDVMNQEAVAGSDMYDADQPKEENFDQVLEDQIKTDQPEKTTESSADGQEAVESAKDASPAEEKTDPPVSTMEKVLAKAAGGNNENPVSQKAKETKPGEVVSVEAKADTSEAEKGVSETAKQNVTDAGQAISETAKQNNESVQTDKPAKPDGVVSTEAKAEVQQCSDTPEVKPENVPAAETAGNTGLPLEGVASKGSEGENAKPVVEAASSQEQAAAKVSGVGGENANTESNSQSQQNHAKETPIENPGADNRAVVEDGTNKPVVNGANANTEVPAGGDKAANVNANANAQQHPEQPVQSAEPKVTAAAPAIENAVATVVNNLPTQKNGKGQNANADVPAGAVSEAKGLSSGPVDTESKLAGEDIVSVEVKVPKAQQGQMVAKNVPTPVDAAQSGPMDQVVEVASTAVESTESTTSETAVSNGVDRAGSINEQLESPMKTAIALGSKQVIIRLDPPELGKVSIKFSENGDQVSGVLEVDKMETKEQIQRQLPEIIQNLNNSGVQVKKIEVVLTGQQEQNTNKDQSSNTSQNPWSEQQEASDNSGFRRNSSSYDQWSGDADRSMDASEGSIQYFDTSINMLA